MSATRRSIAAAIGAALLLLLASGRAWADEARASELINLLTKQPADMPEQTWKEKRRDAAQELGDLGDKRAVPVLIQVVESEEFDIVGEFAIEALGKLRDERAIPILQRVAADRTRDRDQQRAAKKALARLGASAGEAPPPDQRKDDSGSALSTPVASSNSSVSTPSDPPTFDDDVLAAGEIVRFALGGLSLDYDTIRDRPTFNGNAAGSYQRQVDKKRSAWRYGVDAGTNLGLVNYDGEDSSSRYGAFNARMGA